MSANETRRRLFQACLSFVSNWQRATFAGSSNWKILSSWSLCVRSKVRAIYLNNCDQPFTISDWRFPSFGLLAHYKLIQFTSQEPCSVFLKTVPLKPHETLIKSQIATSKCNVVQFISFATQIRRVCPRSFIYVEGVNIFLWVKFRSLALSSLWNWWKFGFDGWKYSFLNKPDEKIFDCFKSSTA